MVFTESFFYWIQFSWCLLLLGWASIQDITMREVYDYTWIIGIIGGIILHLLFYLIFHHLYWLRILLNLLGVGIFIGLMLVPKLLHGSSLMGPADLLALITVAFILPYASPNVQYTYANLYIIPVIFNIITNGFLLLLGYLWGNLLWNLFSLNGKTKTLQQSFEEFSGSLSLINKFILLLIGNRIDLNEIQTKPHIKLLEFWDPEAQEWIISLNLNYEMELSSSELSEIVQEYTKHGLTEIWISRLFPLIVCFFGGLLLTAIWGNLVFQFLTFFW